MERKFFAFAVGSQGGIASNCFSGPLNSILEAGEWASKNIGKYKEVCVVETVGCFQRVNPDVSFHPVLHPEVKPAVKVNGGFNPTETEDDFYRNQF